MNRGDEEEYFSQKTLSRNSIRRWLDSIATSLESDEKIYTNVFDGIKKKISFDKRKYKGYNIARYSYVTKENVNKENENFQRECPFDPTFIRNFLAIENQISSRIIHGISTPFDGCRVVVRADADDLVIFVTSSEKFRTQPEEKSPQSAPDISKSIGLCQSCVIM